MTATDVIWFSVVPDTPCTGYWDHGYLHELVDLFDVEHHELRDEIPEGRFDGAVVVIPARGQKHRVADINAQLAHLDWCVVILAGDEESVFPHEQLDHPNMTVWVMSPKRGRHDDVSFRIGSGYRQEQRAVQADIGDAPRVFDWYFAGQVTHQTRRDCAATLREMRNGRLVESPGFGQGLAQRDYLENLVRSKFVPAPSGPVSPDSFRMFEALEAGCVPIGDTPDWWPFLFGEPVPFPTVGRWSQLVDVMPTLVAEWPRNANRVFAWWQGYKRRTADRLEDDVRLLSGVRPARRVDDEITVIMPTNPIPSHPSTEMIERTIQSVRDRLPDTEILVTIDGPADDVTDTDRAAYDEYIRRLLWLTNNKYTNVVPLLSDRHQHQTGMTRDALPWVRTPLILYVEHDTPLYGDIPFADLGRVVRGGTANTIRLNHDTHIPDEHWYLMVDPAPTVADGVPMLRSTQWSQRPHLTSTAYYRHICTHFWDDQPRFIEHVMYGTVLANPWDDAKLWIYHPDGNIMRSTNLNGRAYTPQEQGS